MAERKAGRGAPDKRQAERHGRRSETFAALLLQMKLYRILGRRVRTPLGEIDLIARAPFGPVCFVEVKARGDEMQASDAIASRQQARIARAAAHYLASRPGLASKGARFDVISVIPGRLPRHIVDAWRADD
ncbi:MAG: YraN family protein [Alphaproteobacteria bacterium]|nr:YraN family protein [Alphaproteobacteria bacterium]